MKYVDKIALIMNLILPMIVCGQRTHFDLPVNKHKSHQKGLYQQSKEFQSGYSGISFFYSYYETNFLNPLYSESISNGDLVKQFGSNLKLRIDAAYPFLLDMDWFSSRFVYEGTNNPDLLKTPKIRHRGIEVTSSLVLLPSYKKFNFYLGIGYQSGSLIASNYWPLESEESKDNIEAAEEKISYQSNCSSPIWKIGASVLFAENYLLLAEYKQSFNSNSTKSFNQFNIGLGLRVKN